MSIFAATGRDTIIINGRILNDFGKGDVAKLTFPEEQWTVNVGKNGNAVYAFRYTGLVVEAELLILLGSADDKFLNAINVTAINDPAAVVLIDGEVIKNVGDGKGNISQVVYLLNGGIIKKGIETVENTDGDEKQVFAQYFLKFGNGTRQNT